MLSFVGSQLRATLKLFSVPSKPSPVTGTIAFPPTDVVVVPIRTTRARVTVTIPLGAALSYTVAILPPTPLVVCLATGLSENVTGVVTVLGPPAGRALPAIVNAKLTIRLLRPAGIAFGKVIRRPIRPAAHPGPKGGAQPLTASVVPPGARSEGDIRVSSREAGIADARIAGSKARLNDSVVSLPLASILTPTV